MDKYYHLKSIKIGISQTHKINESIKDTENPLPLSMIEPNSEQKIKNMISNIKLNKSLLPINLKSSGGHKRNTNMHR
jgi:hypothetical protein